MENQSQALLWAIALWAAISLFVLWRKGVLGRQAFKDAPVRTGRLHIGDLFITLGLWVLGPAIVVAAFHPGTILQFGRPDAGPWLMRMAWGYAGLLPAGGFVLWRAWRSMDGGLTGFGLGLKAIGAGWARAAVGLVAVLPLVFIVSLALTYLLTRLGYEQSPIAHPLLTVILEAPKGVAWWGLVVLAVVAAPLLEELIYRGLLQTVLQQSRLMRNRWTAVATAAFLFALIHLGTVEPQALPQLYVLGLGLGWVYERYGNLWAPMAMHTLFNVLQILLVLYAL